MKLEKLAKQVIDIAKGYPLEVYDPKAVAAIIAILEKLDTKA